jgi:ABC-type Fe3+-hydroxamate transport system substrate-binding protein
VVGRTRFCIHPAPEVGSITRVGGTKEVHFDRIEALHPDLIICEKEENTPEMVSRLSAAYPVVVFDVRSVDGAIGMIASLGHLTALPEAATLAARIRQTWTALIPRHPAPRTAYLIWRQPWMGAGQDTYIGDVLRRSGYTNVLETLPGRYPVVTPDQLRALAPELVLLSSEPFPFGAAHMEEVQAWLPDADIRLVDGEVFSWYGVRMLKAAACLTALASGKTAPLMDDEG